MGYGACVAAPVQACLDRHTSNACVMNCSEADIAFERQVAISGHLETHPDRARRSGPT